MGFRSAWIACVTFLLFSAQLSYALYLPANRLKSQDNINRVYQISEPVFHQIAKVIGAHFAPVIANHGKVLQIIADWKDPEVNAFASREENIWRINLMGGLARRPEVTPDGFAMVVCHELGHHLAGYPFYSGREMATEGASDYFATQVCLRKVFLANPKGNEKYRFMISKPALDACDRVWGTQIDRDVCYRTVQAGVSVARLFHALDSADPASKPRTRERDRAFVDVTYERHPNPQCRLDTYAAGAMCTNRLDLRVIPGLFTTGPSNSLQAERVAMSYSCKAPAGVDPLTGILYGARPRCWFKGQE